MRLLLRHSDWWAHLSSADHGLLHELGGLHGDVVAWLEQQITEHGDLTWSALEQAMQDQAWHATARQWVASAAADEEQCLADLQRVVHRLWCTRLRDELSALIGQGQTGREQLDAVAALNERIRFHLQAERELASPADTR